MADIPLDERRFTDEEIREILKEAVEKAPPRALAKGEGLSLEELKAIGGEVGIAPGRLEDAARAVALRERNQPNRLLGAPTVLDFERRVEGELDPEDTPEVLSIIRRNMGLQGEVDEIHGSLEWKAVGEGGERYVTLSPKDGTTTIRSSANLTNAAILTYLPVGALGLIATFAGLIKSFQNGSQLGIVVFLAVLPILWPILRTILRRFSGSEAVKLEKVVDELARLTED